MTFNDLTFEEVRTGHFQAKQQFGRYQLSVILEPGKTLYEAAVFDDDLFVQLPGIHPNYYEAFSDDVIPNLLPDDVSGIMHKLKMLEGPK
jgi:phospholipase C